MGHLPEKIIYLHGFRSSPKSFKAQCFAQYVRESYPSIEFIVPELPFEAVDAISMLEGLIERSSDIRTGIVGSSLGGYYSIYLAEKYGLKAALVNPAVKPYELLSDYLGPVENLYTGQVDYLEPHHMDDLLSFKVEKFSRPENLYILTQTLDETLDYRQAIEIFGQSPFWIQAGGNHEFEGFRRVIPSIIHFLST